MWCFTVQFAWIRGNVQIESLNEFWCQFKELIGHGTFRLLLLSHHLQQYIDVETNDWPNNEAFIFDDHSDLCLFILKLSIINEDQEQTSISEIQRDNLTNWLGTLSPNGYASRTKFFWSSIKSGQQVKLWKIGTWQICDSCLLVPAKFPPPVLQLASSLFAHPSSARSALVLSIYVLSRHLLEKLSPPIPCGDFPEIAAAIDMLCHSNDSLDSMLFYSLKLLPRRWLKLCEGSLETKFGVIRCTKRVFQLLLSKGCSEYRKV